MINSKIFVQKKRSTSKDIKICTHLAIKLQTIMGIQFMSLDVSILQTRIGTIAISPLIQRFQSGSRVAVTVSEGCATLGLGCSLRLSLAACLPRPLPVPCA